jgi:hypothetical protein
MSSASNHDIDESEEGVENSLAGNKRSETAKRKGKPSKTRKPSPLSASVNNSSSPKKKRRSKKDDPFVIEKITPHDLDNVSCATIIIFDRAENKNAEFVGAETITVDGKQYHLNDELNLDQLRDLTHQLGVKNAGRFTKRECLENIAAEQLIDKSNLDADTIDKDILQRNTLLLLINVVFLSDYKTRFLRLNDGKKHADHETRNMFKNFYQSVTVTYNDDEDLDDSDEEELQALKIYNLQSERWSQKRRCSLSRLRSNNDN